MQCLPTISGENNIINFFNFLIVAGLISIFQRYDFLLTGCSACAMGMWSSVNASRLFFKDGRCVFDKVKEITNMFSGDKE